MSGRNLPTGRERAALVEEMFDRIAGRYELLNTVMTGGMHHLWNRKVIAAANLLPGDWVLDLACGTGSLTRDLARRVGPEGYVLGIDFSREMLRCAEAKPLPNVEYRHGDATDLREIRDAAFDAATIAYGARNIPDLDALFSGMSRVVRPGGRVVCLEIATPESRASQMFYGLWFDRAVPKLGARISGDPEAYTYLPESVKEFVAADDLSGIMERNGLQDVTYRRLAGGIITLHRGVRGL
ncbi:ubiquinone/menaquinone biosynthesis methyltransferase [Rubrobacter radiotolerans]|uniref:Demethylmenaquinone methyltransferase n=1 Tax=Rubrobacter radiotolerans TaxID=42256 RepID=A0A023X4R1_RUBRA|nr:class I SAM-dependent methyltransferase [Rubrobacter radiotolerans]AHY47034.1 ubiquinone/menaquinone biosynthesis methyltransferase [Rubrobacter radiotolerans]MDX5894440.1 class I SAM-dependent methyltransferase [Rubrobacter radiotolerans]SMC06008.1 demethylmenaquinone methyltransferase / 2-methoxy-6-polyprenyl-1,4-benzoquinol methylase [Rubrobacter radiotolerans DSM 5868]